jgi:hypothetical protein
MQKITNIELEAMFTPYTLDTYSTFEIGSDDDMEIENYNEINGTDLSYYDFNWTYDNESFLHDIAKKRLELMRDNILDDVIIGIKKDGEPWSPREYNFSTDNANNIYTVNIKKLKQYIKDNQEDYNKNKLKDRDGFMWFGDDHQTMLNYYLRTESAKENTGYTQDDYIVDIYDAIRAHEYVTFEPITK